MLLLIVPLITFTISLCYWIFIERDVSFGIPASLLLTIIILLIIFVIGAVVTSCGAIEWIETDTTELIALKDNISIEDNFYLRCGYIEGSLFYCYIIDTPIGLKTECVPANKCYIKYTNNKPYIVTYKSQIKNDFVRWAFGNISDTRYTIYLPEGSVISDYYGINLE